MSVIAGSIDRLIGQITAGAAGLGLSLDRDLRPLTSREGLLPLEAPGLWSANRSCRMVQAADGWIALNLARDDDRELIPAWLGADAGADAWAAVVEGARGRPWRELIAAARPLGLPVAGVGEIAAASTEAPRFPLGQPGFERAERLRVLDLSALWAGPLCGAVLAALGADVTKVESLRRPDSGRVATPEFYARLNAGKAELALDFAADQARLQQMMLQADVVITSARPRAFAQLDLAPDWIFAERPTLVWVAISGYGWGGEAADRVAFGDDAAAAGGLVGRTPAGAPQFLGDALADPLTGLAAAAGALTALQDGGGQLVDAALALTAAGAAAELGLARAA